MALRRTAALIGSLIAASACASGGHSSSAAPPPGATAADVAPAPTVTTTDPGELAQTRDRPSGTDPAFRARMSLLWDAIATGHVGTALPAFFPLAAYRVVKAVRDPASDWQHRLVGAFDADIRKVHASLGAGAPSATLVAVNVPDDRATWVSPGAEVNKVGYWRVYDTTLIYSVGGVQRSLLIISLISWRGQWYVVHFRTPPR